MIRPLRRAHLIIVIAVGVVTMALAITAILRRA